MRRPADSQQMQVEGVGRFRGPSPNRASPLWSAATNRRSFEMAFYELRQYNVRPGKMAQWLKIMEEEIIPFQVAKGMVITGSYKGETDESVYVWMRRFESEAQKEALYTAVYQSDHWKKEIAPRIPDLLDREKAVVTRIVPTPRSTAQ